jgi:hypothetical protein
VVTIPTNLSVPFITGTVIAVIRRGTGATTIQAAGGVTLNGTSGGSVSITARWQGATLLKVDTDEWIASGAI